MSESPLKPSARPNSTTPGDGGELAPVIVVLRLKRVAGSPPRLSRSVRQHRSERQMPRIVQISSPTKVEAVAALLREYAASIERVRDAVSPSVFVWSA
jgi:hypothetical protein